MAKLQRHGEDCGVAWAKEQRCGTGALEGAAGLQPCAAAKTYGRRSLSAAMPLLAAASARTSNSQGKRRRSLGRILASCTVVSSISCLLDSAVSMQIAWFAALARLQAAIEVCALAERSRAASTAQITRSFDLKHWQKRRPHGSRQGRALAGSGRRAHAHDAAAHPLQLSVL